jgi:hypothetical protein
MANGINNMAGASSSSYASKVAGLTLILLLVVFSCILLWKMELSLAFAFFIPVAVLLALLFIRAPKTYAIILFSLFYLLAGIGRYFPSIKVGIAFDGGLVIFTFILFFSTLFGKIDWKNSMNGASLLTLIWLIYCVFELFNPKVVSTNAWVVTIRWTAIYYFVVVFFTPLVIGQTRDVKHFVYVWALLTIFAVFWILKQKYIGLDKYESIWLADPIISNTHVLPFGIRYWSLFTDAANAAACLALSSAFFGILMFFTDSKKEKRYFAFIAILSLWGSLFTGTRSHLVIPFCALLVLIVCSKNKRLAFWSIVTIIALIAFFRGTNIGDSNRYIWRARSAFFFNQDASYIVRQKNHAKIKAYMADKPFGIGLGLAEWKAKRFVGTSVMAEVNTDSWIYTLFVETGIVGVLLYVAIYLYFIIYGMWISLFKLKTKFIRGIAIASTGGIAGMLASSYGNEILIQFPNGIIVFVLIALIFACPYLDKKRVQEDNEQGDIKLDSGNGTEIGSC